MFANNANHHQKKILTDGTSTSSSSNSVRASRYQGTLPDISEDDSVSQEDPNKNREVPENAVLESEESKGFSEEKLKESIMKDPLVVTTIAGLRERQTMLSFMINDCQASFEEKKKYRQKRKQRVLLYKTVIKIMIIILIGFFYYLIISNFIDVFLF